MGNQSPVGADIMPNFDPYVGQTLAFDVLTNWCSYVAATGIDIVASLPNVNVASNGPFGIGCQNTDPTFTLGAAARSLATASATTQSEVAFKTTVQPSPYDCHVPYVKGLKLRKAKARLHKANCRARVRYVKGERANRVRYQPIKVGTGKPRHFRVTLAVAR